PRPAPSAPPVVPETVDDAPPAADYGSNGSASPDASFASAAGSISGSILSAPVPGDAISAPADLAAEAAPAPEPETFDSPAKPERVAVTSDAGDSSSYKTFDVTTTRRRPVVFEEDDDLDVPDFLK